MERLTSPSLTPTSQQSGTTHPAPDISADGSADYAHLVGPGGGQDSRPADVGSWTPADDIQNDGHFRQEP